MVSHLAVQLIENPGGETTKLLFNERNDEVFWVDWREAEDMIVSMAAEALGTQDLSCEWQDRKFFVRYKNQLTPVPLEFVPGEQDKTLWALNKAISPDYEVRFIWASEGGDTLAFMALAADAWKTLESKFGKKVEDAFMSLDDGSPLFG